MNEATEFLHSLGQALSTMSLYGERHAARERAASRAFDSLRMVLDAEDHATISFVEGDVIFAQRPLREFKSWKWADELVGVAVERIEIDDGVERDEFQRFLDELSARLVRKRSFEKNEDAFDADIRLPHIQFGQLSVGTGDVERAPGAESAIDLDEEIEAMDWLFDQAQRNGRVAGTVAEAVVRSVSVALHQSRGVLELLVPLKEIDQYTTVHSMNAGILTMALAESLGVGSSAVRTLVEAALLHDVGKTQISRDILQKPGHLSDEEWQVVQRHPTNGARVLVHSGPEMELAAVVAYEHHMKWDGTGYPTPEFGRKPHRATRIVQICDVYDALRTRRSFREAWEQQRILTHLREESGRSFDPDIVRAFIDLVGEWDVSRT